MYFTRMNPRTIDSVRPFEDVLRICVQYQMLFRRISILIISTADRSHRSIDAWSNGFQFHERHFYSDTNSMIHSANHSIMSTEHISKMRCRLKCSKVVYKFRTGFWLMRIWLPKPHFTNTPISLGCVCSNRNKSPSSNFVYIFAPVSTYFICAD